MKIVERGILSRADAGTRRANLTFPCVLPLSNGTVLATCRAGVTKDGSDETIELYRSHDGGRTWNQSPVSFGETTVHGLRGTLKVCYLTEISHGHLLAACMWVDRTTYPGKPVFNPETEGCLPAAILLADSHDFGVTWAPWRVVPMPAKIGPPSLTNPVLKLADGRLVLSIETNKQYEDRSKWYQHVVLFYSTDLGQTWTGPTTAAQDPTGRIFHWDQRAGVAADGRIATFLWIYDTETRKYLNARRRISSDGGRTWTPAEDLGITDQPGVPAMLPDGRVVLPWVDRFQTHSIRARLAPSVAAPLDPQTEVAIYAQSEATLDAPRETLSAELVEMSLWTFGLPFAAALPDGDVIVVYYAGTLKAMDIHWARLHV